MSNDLMLPQVPEAKPDDPEDVSWALSTAEAMWARGDHADGIKWVRRAAEAASEAERDLRALELAKSAADLAGLISRHVSRPSIDLEEIEPIAVAESSPPPLPTTPRSKPASKPSANAKAPKATVTKPLGSAKPTATLRFDVDKAERPEKKEAKRPRRSRENLDVETRKVVGAGATAKHPPFDTSTASNLLPTDTTETAVVDLSSGSGAPSAAFGGPSAAFGDLSAGSSHLSAAGDPSAAFGDDERMTVVAAPGDPRLEALSRKLRPSHLPAPKSAASAPIPAAGKPASPTMAPPAEPHDPEITTTQAVRVVVWRDASGVHVAPAGTVVSAITVDAVLVALEPKADLTAWLTRKGR